MRLKYALPLTFLYVTFYNKQKAVRRSPMNVEQNIALFQEQIMCGYTVYTWQFDPDIRLLNTNCPHSGIFDEALTLFDCKATLAEQAKASSQPMILSSPIGLVWAAAFQKSEDELQRVYVLGPILTTENDVHAMDRALREYASKKRNQYRLAQPHDGCAERCSCAAGQHPVPVFLDAPLLCYRGAAAGQRPEISGCAAH